MSYILGIILAIGSGFVNNLGVLLQKKVINEHLDDPEFLKKIAKNPTWIVGLLLQILLGGAIFFLLAQIYLGPALVPALMSAGLILLAIGSIKILNETLKWQEIIGILIMIIGIVFISFSELSVDVVTYNILDPGFIIRITVFTCIYIAIVIGLFIYLRKIDKFKGIIYALISGFIYSLGTFWIGTISAFLTHLFSGSIILGEIILFIPSLIIVIIGTAYGIIFAQKSFKEGHVNILSPLIGVPGQITPIIAYFLVFILVPPSNFSILFIVLGLLLVITSSFLLASRQAKLEEIEA
jgi:drug/metabolite transporter (DMT)-like permease